MAKNKKTDLGGVMILNGNDTGSFHRVGVESLQPDTIRVTGEVFGQNFNPEDKLAFVRGEHTDQELEAKGKLLNDTADLTRNIRGTLKGTDDIHNNITLAERYERLLECIKDYEKADPLVQAAVGDRLNRAINSMNREHSDVNINRTITENESSLTASLAAINPRSVSAHDELKQAFEKYRELTPDEQYGVLPIMQQQYRAYMDKNIDSAEIKNDVLHDYSSLRKTFPANITFDTEPLQASKEAPIMQDLTSLDGSKLSYQELETLTGYRVLTPTDIKESIEVYNSYLPEALQQWKDDAVNFLHMEDELKKYFNIEMTPEIKEQLETWKATPGASIPDLISEANIPKVEPSKTTSELSFSQLSLQDQGIAYNEYLRIVDEYIEAHPRSAHAKMLKEHMSNQYAESVNAKYPLEIMEDIKQVRALDSSSNYFQREQAVYQINDLMDAYSRLNDETRNAYRGLIEDAVNHFNDYKLHNVVVPNSPTFEDKDIPVITTASEFNRYISNYQSADIDFQREHFQEMVDVYSAYASSRKIASLNEQFESNVAKAQIELDKKLEELKDIDDKAKQEIKDTFNQLTSNFAEKSYEEKQTVIENMHAFCEQHQLEEFKIINNAGVKFEAAVSSYCQNANFDNERTIELTNNIVYGSNISDNVKTTADFIKNDVDANLESLKKYNEVNTQLEQDIAAMRTVLGEKEALNTQVHDDLTAITNKYFINADGTERKVDDLTFEEKAKCANELMQIPSKISIQDFDADSFASVGQHLEDFNTVNDAYNYFSNHGMTKEDIAMVSQVMIAPTPEKETKDNDYGTDQYLQDVLGIMQENNIDAKGFFESDFAKQHGIKNLEDLNERIGEMSYIEKLQCTQQLTNCCPESSVVEVTSRANNSEFIQQEVAKEITDKITEQEELHLDPVIKAAIEKKLQEEAMKQFEQDTEDLKAAEALRGGVVHAKTLEDTNEMGSSIESVGKKWNELSDGAKAFLATTIADKVEGFSLSGKQNSELLYTGFHDDKEIVLKVEEIVGSHCFIGRVADSEERMLIVTPQQLDFDLSKADKEAYSKLAGMQMLQADVTIEDQMRFGMEEGKFMVTMPVPVDKLDQASAIQSEHIHYDAEVLKITPTETGSTLLLKDPETQNLFEVKTTLSEHDIYRDAIIDVRFDAVNKEAHLNQGDYALTKDFDVSLHNNGQHAIIGMTSMWEIGDETWQKNNSHPTNTIGTYEFEKKDDELYVNLNGEQRIVAGFKEIEIDDAKHFSALVVDPEHPNDYIQIIDSRTAKDVENSLVSQDCKERILSDEDKCMGIVNYFGNTCVGIKEGDDNHFYPITDIDNNGGKARVFYLDQSDGQRYHVTLDSNYEDACHLFANGQAKLEYRHSTEHAEASQIINNNDEIYYSYTNQDGATKQGLVIAANDKGCLINIENEGIKFVNDNTACEQLMHAQNISTLIEDGVKQNLVCGNGNSYTETLHYTPLPSRESIVADIVQPENSSEFIRDSFKTDSKGDRIFTTRDVNDLHTQVENEEIVYLHAQLTADEKSINVFMVTQTSDKMTGYQLENVSFQDFQIMAQHAKIHELAQANELEALHKINQNEPVSTEEVQSVINAFNRMESNSVNVENIKHTPEPGDISLAHLTQKDGVYVLQGKDYENHAITIQNPIMKRENGEMYIYSMTEDGMQKNRIISTAFGKFDEFDNINAKAMEWGRFVDASQVFHDVNVEHTTFSNFTSKTTEISELFERKYGMSCSSELDRPISANTLKIVDPGASRLDENKISVEYGVIIQDTPRGPEFIYYEPDANSNLNCMITMNTNQSLSVNEIPMDRMDATKKGFVLIDYENGVAIKEGGMCYYIDDKTHNEFMAKLADEGKPYPKNFYDDKIAQPESALHDYSTFVSPEMFKGKSIDIQPIVDEWSISRSNGKFMLQFNDMCMDEHTSTIGKDFQITHMKVADDGIYATLSQSMSHDANTTSQVYEVRLGMPTEKQIQAIYEATNELPVTTARQRIDAYCEQIVLQNSKDNYTSNKIDLYRGEFVSVQDTNSKLGVLYKVVDNEGNLMLVGNSDNENVHASFLTKAELEHRAISKVELPEDAVSRMRFAENVVYTETQVLDDGRAKITLGDRDLRTDHVNGPTYVCNHTESYKIEEREADNNKDKDTGAEIGD